MIEMKDALTKTFGAQNFSEDPQILEEYSKDESFVHSLKPWSIVRPQNVSQVQELVKWANETHTPLVPVSSGAPHFRGDTVPSTPGACMVDLSGMKKIIHVDVRNRMVIVEPGVTYSQLQPELAKVGLRISSSLAPRANKSVVANLLEREPITIPRYQWAALDPLRCLEVVWGDGQKMFTGEAGSLGTLEEEWAKKLFQVSPFGPAQTDFYKLTSAAQGSMGIVTWASIKCEQLPSMHNMYFVADKKLDSLLDLAYTILGIRFADELLILNKWQLASLLGKDACQIETLANTLPAWALLVGIAGRDRLPKERIAYQVADISEMAQKYGLQLTPAIPGASGVEVRDAVLNPCAGTYWKMTYKGACQEIFFLSTMERSAEFVQTMYSAAEALGYPTSQIGVYIQPVHQGASCHIEFDLPFNRNNPQELSRMQKLYVKASEDLLKQGAYYSRPYGIWANMAYNRDVQTTNVLRKIKGIFDPNNVMNPGKLCF
jgi:FAD/FMN-containing dehydrogenase